MTKNRKQSKPQPNPFGFPNGSTVKVYAVDDEGWGRKKSRYKMESTQGVVRVSTVRMDERLGGFRYKSQLDLELFAKHHSTPKQAAEKFTSDLRQKIESLKEDILETESELRLSTIALDQYLYQPASESKP
jgi:hypothetical protein